ncbi:hypothetical protein GWI33_002081 [Rhynchophorus ferrugineus]|uniref:Uncharacterized protein n=1 Tax=Rhynchophorus ferrugineus TaxID=354439 RepID=A0A834MLP6_RHYFE|nr:hypothetical protein GWI33_002081 [Rhynchophorus ferrugineus]
MALTVRGPMVEGGACALFRPKPVRSPVPPRCCETARQRSIRRLPYEKVPKDNAAKFRARRTRTDQRRWIFLLINIFTE